MKYIGIFYKIRNKLPPIILVASARTWNSLPSSVRNAPSLTTFRPELKTVLFRSSFDNDYAIVIVLFRVAQKTGPAFFIANILKTP